MCGSVRGAPGKPTSLPRHKTPPPAYLAWCCRGAGATHRVRERRERDDCPGGSASARDGLRISIGAGRWRLVQLALMESGWIAMLALALGALFAWWAAPFVVSRINPPDNPARLFLPADWRVFGLALTLGVTFLFGLLPRCVPPQPSQSSRSKAEKTRIPDAA